ncbi:peptidylprolyl isomerase [Phenylobacterium zucineum]|uniref:peptidylprolyl isomerase n=1 Tax=Phenylobacterium zucineum TaxID=284016 RepID=UPI0002F5FEC7|nr:peptidylprolyl isomerase [Phenylobacterium zucineum]
MLRTLGVAIAAVGLMGAGDWRDLDPETALVIETTKGRVVVEMAPAMAPQAVARVKTLAREGVYDGLQFHRVIDGFVAQTGNPNNRDGGTSAHPDLPPEFQFRIPAEAATIVVERSDGIEGLVGAVPFAGVRLPDGRIRGWGAYCPGVAGMGRQADPGTANSEIFFMRAPARRLDHEYTVWGRVVQGQEAVLTVAVGEPPKVPDLMLKVRVAADLPPAERPRLQALDPAGPAFAARLAALKREKGAAFTVCDVDVPIREAPAPAAP